MAASPLLSIVIPTHKRAATLRLCLSHLERQSIAEALQVIIVSDGHDPPTASLFREGQRGYPFPLHFEEVPKGHQGTARNHGMTLAEAPTILFIGDDFLLQPHCCAAHLSARQKLPGAQRDAAVLGFTTWDPGLRINRVMRWLESSGWQFGYPFLEPYRRDFVPEEIQHRFTYSSHVSLPTAVARAHPFRADLTLYGWEDVEWGLRLARDGIGLWYEPTAVAFHHHPMTLQASLERMETLGRSAAAIARTGAIDPRPTGWKKAAYKVIAQLPTMRGKHGRAFLRGIKRGESEA